MKIQDVINLAKKRGPKTVSVACCQDKEVLLAVENARKEVTRNKLQDKVDLRLGSGIEVLKENELSVEDIDWFVLHQANARIVDAVARRLRLDIGKFPMNLQDYGNTSSASIPILLNELNREDVLKKGQKLVLAGFGAGLSWGASVLDWDITE